MKLQYIIRALVLCLTVVSNVYGMQPKAGLGLIVPGPIDSSIAITPQRFVDQTLVNKADAVEKVALQATHGDEIDKEVARANNAVDAALLRLPEDERGAMREFWISNFYDPVNAHTGDIAARVALIQEHSGILLEKIEANMVLEGLKTRLIAMHLAASASAGGDAEDGEGDCQVS